MFKPALVTPEQFKAAPVATDESTANNVFKVLHGAYGNLFLSKFTSGVVDVKGRDQGIASARKVWAYSLRDVPESVVLDALDRCQRDDPEFPPSLPKFMEFCRACAPRGCWAASDAEAPQAERREQGQRAPARLPTWCLLSGSRRESHVTRLLFSVMACRPPLAAADAGIGLAGYRWSLLGRRSDHAAGR